MAKKKIKEFIIQDDSGNDYTVNDMENFRKHIIKYHSVNGRGDKSLHIEDGRNFTVS